MKTLKGVVKWFNVGKGYGFLSSNEVDDIFVHYTAINGDGYKELVEGETVTFDLVEGPKGNQAANVRKA